MQKSVTGSLVVDLRLPRHHIAGATQKKPRSPLTKLLIAPDKLQSPLSASGRGITTVLEQLRRQDQVPLSIPGPTPFRG